LNNLQYFRIFLTSDFVKLLQDPTSDLNRFDPVPSSDDFVDFLRRRALDDSVYVRKNALQVRFVNLKLCNHANFVRASCSCCVHGHT